MAWIGKLSAVFEANPWLLAAIVAIVMMPKIVTALSSAILSHRRLSLKREEILTKLHNSAEKRGSGVPRIRDFGVEPAPTRPKKG